MPPTLHPSQMDRGRWAWCRDPGPGTRSADDEPLPGGEGSGVGPAHAPVTSSAPGHPTQGRATWGQSIKPRGISPPRPSCCGGRVLLGLGWSCPVSRGAGRVDWGREGRTGPVRLWRKGDMAPRAAGGRPSSGGGGGQGVSSKPTEQSASSKRSLSVFGGPRRSRPGASSGPVSAGDRRGQEGTGGKGTGGDKSGGDRRGQESQKEATPGPRKLVRWSLEQGAATSPVCRTDFSKCFKELVGTDFTPKSTQGCRPGLRSPSGQRVS